MTKKVENQRAILILFLAVSGALVLTSATIGETPSESLQYDRKTEVALAGVVREVSDFHCEFGWRGTHLTLDSDRGAILVHVGLASWLQKKRFFLQNRIMSREKICSRQRRTRLVMLLEHK